MSKLHFNIAGAFTFSLIPFFLQNKLHKKNLSVYDSIPNFAWNGGRINRSLPNINIPNLIKNYHSLEISVFYTLSNHIIEFTRDNLNTARYYLDLLNENDGVILQNEELRLFLKNKYPHLLLKFSVTGHDLNAFPLLDEQKDILKYYKDLESKYDLIVPKMEHVSQMWFLDNVNPEKYEIMLNDTCSPNCPYYKEHFDSINNYNSSPNKVISLEKAISSIEECWLPKFNPDTSTACFDGMDLTLSQIELLKEKNFFRYKITGRENSFNELKKETLKYVK